jgi:hypothetical protein
MIYLEILSPVPTTYRQCQHREALYDQSGISAKVQQEIEDKLWQMKKGNKDMDVSFTAV